MGGASFFPFQPPFLRHSFIGAPVHRSLRTTAFLRRRRRLPAADRLARPARSYSLPPVLRRAQLPVTLLCHQPDRVLP